MHRGITQISPPDLVEHHKGIQPYLVHRVSQSSNQYFYSSDLVLTAVSLPLIVSFIIHSKIYYFAKLGLVKILVDKGNI